AWRVAHERRSAGRKRWTNDRHNSIARDRWIVREMRDGRAGHRLDIHRAIRRHRIETLRAVHRRARISAARQEWILRGLAERRRRHRLTRRRHEDSLNGAMLETR